MNIVYECPLGQKCERMKDADTMIRCVLYTTYPLEGPNGETVTEYHCEFTWHSIFAYHAARNGRSAVAATESSRNEIVKRQDLLNGILLKAQQRVLKLEG